MIRIEIDDATEYAEGSCNAEDKVEPADQESSASVSGSVVPS